MEFYLKHSLIANTYLLIDTPGPLLGIILANLVTPLLESGRTGWKVCAYTLTVYIDSVTVSVLFREAYRVTELVCKRNTFALRDESNTLTHCSSVSCITMLLAILIAELDWKLIRECVTRVKLRGCLAHTHSVHSSVSTKQPCG